MATPQEERQGTTLKGEIGEFWLGGDLPKRRWFTVNLPFRDARRLFKTDLYDPVRGKGEQRQLIPLHVRALKRAMLRGDFTPAPWSGAIRETHRKNHLEIKGSRVTLNVTERLPLPLIDAGHRKAALEAIREDFKGDKEMVSLVDNLTITVQVYLDPEKVRSDFRHLQEGRSVSKSHTRYMREMEGDVDPKRARFLELARIVATRLNEDERSYFHHQIKFISGQAGALEFSSVATYGGSDLGTSLYGGAKIALFDKFDEFFDVGNENSRADFLIECYNAVYEGIFKYDEKDEFTNQTTGKRDSFPRLITTGRALRPINLQGTKGGTGLLTMLGNMLAFRLLAVKRRTDIEPKDLKALVAAAQKTLDLDVQEAGGGSGPARRQLTGEFVREYFRDVVKLSDEDEHDLKKMEAVDGIPALLCEVILTRSTLEVDKDATVFSGPETAEEVVKGRKARVNPNRPAPVDTAEDFVDEGPAPLLPVVDDAGDMVAPTDGVDIEFTPPPPKRGRKPKEALMG